jgi:predicted negative regulator of RcsB-dependent stress response
MLEFLIPVVIGIVLGAVIVQIWQVWQIHRELSEMEEEVAETLEELEKETLIILEVEPINDQFLCYNHFTKDFVCKGRNIVEIVESFKQRYPNKNAAIARGNPAALAVLKQQLKEATNENSISI